VPGKGSAKLEIRPLTPERWPDLEAIFASRGCSIARQCWCMAYRRAGTHPTPHGMTRGAFNKSQFKAVVDGARPPGLIAYRNETPVGWLSLGPREDYKRLERSPIMGPVDDKPVWSVICFVVPSGYRGQGIARALLEAGIDYAKKRGARLVEAYPVDKGGHLKDDSLWFGTKSMYDHAGFQEVARRKPTRPVVRLKVR